MRVQVCRNRRNYGPRLVEVKLRKKNPPIFYSKEVYNTDPMSDLEAHEESQYYKQALALIESHQVRELKHLLKAHPRAVLETDVKERTLLHYAVLENNLELVETVIKFHPDFNSCHDEDGLLPIHLAMKKNNLQIIKSLIHHGADLNAQAEEGTYSGYTILHFAVNGDYCTASDAEHIFVLPDLDVEVGDEKQRTAAHIAAYHNNIDCVKLLIAKGAEMDKKDDQKITPLLLAACRGHTAVVSYLLNHAEVEINTQDKAGDSALHLAVQVQVQRVFNYNFPLEDAHYECAYVLTRHGIDVDMLNRDGDSALDIVHENFAELLELVSSQRKYLPHDKTLRELCLLPATTFVSAGMQPEPAVKLFNACGKWMGDIQEKENADATRKPCTLIKTDQIPRMRKFQELREQMEKDGVLNTNDEKSQNIEHNPEYYYKKYENSANKCPFGFSAEDPKKITEDQNAAKCPFGFTADDAKNSNGVQNNNEAINIKDHMKRVAKNRWKMWIGRVLNDSTFWLTTSMGIVLAAAWTYSKYQK